MIRWTTKGAVSTPTTVQIRVERHFPGRIRAGAPEPSRSLGSDELLANLRHFTEGLRGPRTAPCTGLVLSGAGVVARPDLQPALQQARAWGIERVVLHLDASDLASLEGTRLAGLDHLVVPLQPGPGLDARVARLRAELPPGLRLHTHTPLTAAALQDIDALPGVLATLHPDGAAFTFPFPLGEGPPPPPPDVVMRRLGPILDALADQGQHAWVNGLPACFVGPYGANLRRATNRWYVDADHQQADALLFFPDVLAFHKADICRFCAADPTCDGFFARWLSQPGWPALRPLEAAPS